VSAIVEISRRLVASTVTELRASTDTERVVLWLGERMADQIVVRDVFVPVQYSCADFFHIPPRGMDELLRNLRARRLMVAAQVHTHPEAAFHSWADDQWAIVRHTGALSLVVPRFCQDTTSDTFVRDALVYRLSENDQFVLVDAVETFLVTT